VKGKTYKDSQKDSLKTLKMNSQMIVIKKKISKEKKQQKERTTKFNAIFNNEDLIKIIINHKIEIKLNDAIEEFKKVNEIIKECDNETKNGKRVSQTYKELLHKSLYDVDILERTILVLSNRLKRVIIIWNLAKSKKINDIIYKKLNKFEELRSYDYYFDIEF
jgi:exonuclease VII small subunit